MRKHEQTEQTDERQIDTTVIGDPTSVAGAFILPNDGVPTQVANPVRTTLRTVAAGLVGLLVALPTVNLVLAALQDYLNEQTAVVIPAPVWLVLNGATAVVVLLSGIVTRVLAVPGVNTWVKRHLPGLAAIPLRPVGTPPNQE